MVSVPVRWPAAVGVNVTAIEQFAPAATEPPQVLVCAKSPDAVMLVTVSAAVPLLVSVTDCGALCVCTVWLLNVRLAGDSEAVAPEDPGGFVTGVDVLLPP